MFTFLNIKNKRIFKLLLVVMLVVTTASFVALPVLASSHDYGLSDTAKAAKLDIFGSADDLPSKIGIVIFAILSFIGVIFLVIVIYGGFLWMTAGGNTEQTKKASTMIRNGVIGIIIISLSYGLTLFIFDNILVDSGSSSTSSSTTTFTCNTSGAPVNCVVVGGCPAGQEQPSLTCPSGEVCCFE
jgi:hypothetical protein